MKFNSIVIAFALLVPGLLFAQVNPGKCGSFDVVKYRETQEPGYINRVNATFNAARQLADANKYSRAAQDTIYKIQVVFHIIYNNATQNIPDSVIYSQMEVLNEDYRRLNADTVRTRDTFKVRAADARIEFELATVDPDGNPTNGILHIQRPSPGFLGYEPFTDNAKATATGGNDPWPTDRYLNIWVCNVLNGLGVLGYAFPPSNAPNWPNGSATDSSKQGVVLHYPVVGRNYSAPIDPSVTKGRSAVHEIGHYLGLRHIWGDGDCTEDDGIDDTPDATAAHQQTCDSASNSCTETPEVPDMIENFMDYSHDQCLNMFTHGQVGLMRAMLQTSRAGIARTVIVGDTATNPTGIKDEVLIQQVSVFPNPSSGLVGLNVRAKGNSYSYVVMNALGQVLASEANVDAAIIHRSIDLSLQPAGMYFVRVNAGGNTVVKKFQLTK